MINLFKKNLLNIGYHLNIKNIKVLRYSSHNNDIKVSFNRNFKVYRKETTTDYGKKLIKNEILGQSWISTQMNESKKNLIYNYEIKNKGCFIDLKEFSGKKLDYLQPLTRTKKNILKVIKFYSKTWPKKKKVPCHGDLTFDNIIFSKNKIRIIDWECFNCKGEFWGYDLVYFVLSAATFPYYKRGFLPSEDQKILRNIWIKLKNLGLDNKVLTNPNNELRNIFQKKHWQMILKRSPKKLFPMFMKNKFANHINSIIN